MKFKIYDYEDISTICAIPEDLKEVKLIIVCLIAGDEFITIKTENNIYSFDANESFIRTPLFDTMYFIDNEKDIRDWFLFIFKEDSLKSYERAKHFIGRRKE